MHAGRGGGIGGAGGGGEADGTRDGRHEAADANNPDMDAGVGAVRVPVVREPVFRVPNVAILRVRHHGADLLALPGQVHGCHSAAHHPPGR